MALPVTYDKNTVSTTDPWDESTVTIIEVTNVRVDSVFVQDRFSFPDGTTDPVIDDKVKTQLRAEGYDV